MNKDLERVICKVSCRCQYFYLHGDPITITNTHSVKVMFDNDTIVSRVVLWTKEKFEYNSGGYNHIIENIVPYIRHPNIENLPKVKLQDYLCKKEN